LRRVDREKYPHLYKRQLEHGRSEEGRAMNKKAVKKYVSSEKGRGTREAYRVSGAGRNSHRRANKRYRNDFDGNMQRRIYNKGLSEAEALKAKQAFQNFDGRCYCCGSLDPGTKNGWHLDHKDNKFRGILCHGCNVAAAMLKDNPLRCDLLGTYLIDFIRKQGMCSQLEMCMGALNSTER
jgi:hypothetical protein